MLETPQGDACDVAPADRDMFAHQPLEMKSQAAQIVKEGFPGVFIRAPRFVAEELSCTPVAMLGDEIVGVLDGMRLGLTFHPELTLDRRFHRWLLSQAEHTKGAE